MVEKLLRYWKGIVRVRITGNSPERFLNLCHNYHIVIWHLAYQEDAYECEMALEDFRRIRPIVHKSHTRLQIVKRMGIPFFLYRNRKRKVTYISCMLFFTILYVMSLFIWDIQFEGNQKYTDEILMEFVNSHGYVQGMWVDSVKCEELEKAIRAEYEDINWVSAMIDGTRLTVKIKENTGILHVEKDEEQPGDLVADKGGKVHSIITRRGTPAVVPGMEVQPGDLLVSKTVEIFDDGGGVMASHEVEADADVILERNYEYKDTIPYEYLVRKYTDSQTFHFIQFLDYRFQLFPAKLEEQTELITTRHQCKLFSNFYLPIYYGSSEKRSYEEWSQTYSEEQLTLLSQQKLQCYIENLEKLGVEIIQNSVKIRWDANGCISEGNITVYEKAGILQSGIN